MILIGSIKFPLENIEKQDEYELELIIPDEEDERINAANIKAKITFIWSEFMLYQELHRESEAELEKLKIMIDNSFRYLEMLNGKVS